MIFSDKERLKVLEILQEGEEKDISKYIVAIKRLIEEELVERIGDGKYGLTKKGGGCFISSYTFERE